MPKKHKRYKMRVKASESNYERDTGNQKLARWIDSIESRGEEALRDIPLSDCLDENFDKVSEVFKDNFDVVLRRFTLGSGGIACFIVYLHGLTDVSEINKSVLSPLMTMEYECGEDLREISRLMEKIKLSVIRSAQIKTVLSFQEAIKGILGGKCVLFFEGSAIPVAVEIRQWKARQVSDAKVEPVVRGPQEAFVEDLLVNTALIRRRLRTSDLKMEQMEVGRLSKTPVVVAYIKGLAEDGIVREVKKRIAKIDIDIVPDSGYLEKLMDDNAYSPFPLTKVTEKPDKCVAALSEGRVVVMIDGSPFSLIVPITFADFLMASEDYYVSFYFSSVMRILRYAGFIIALLLPSLYIAVTTFHQEMIPLTLLIRITQSRAEVPFPAFVEALVMEIAFEILREAGIRIPQPVGQSISIVGGLVIGQGAVEAGIVSQAMVIVVAITGIASFCIPAFNAAISLRFLRFPIMVLASTLGFFGIIMGVLFLLVHMVSLRSFGVPYLSPAAPLSFRDLKDSIIQAPLWAMGNRPSFIQKSNRRRIGKDVKPGPPEES